MFPWPSGCDTEKMGGRRCMKHFGFRRVIQTLMRRANQSLLAAALPLELIATHASSHMAHRPRRASA